jgi:hypothetical protein
MSRQSDITCYLVAPETQGQRNALMPVMC